MNHRDGKKGAQTHEVGVNDEQSRRMKQEKKKKKLERGSPLIKQTAKQQS